MYGLGCSFSPQRVLISPSPAPISNLTMPTTLTSMEKSYSRRRIAKTKSCVQLLWYRIKGFTIYFLCLDRSIAETWFDLLYIRYFNVL